MKNDGVSSHSSQLRTSVSELPTRRISSDGGRSGLLFVSSVQAAFTNPFWNDRLLGGAMHVQIKGRTQACDDRVSSPVSTNRRPRKVDGDIAKHACLGPGLLLAPARHRGSTLR